jgi:Short-chain alcohol dehydrogenase of unknown specificity
MQDLTGKVAVVTGAASGIGLGCARTFARAGMKVALCDLRADPLAAAVDNVRALGGEAIGIATDVSKKESVEQAAERVIREFGKIHIAMNNAGVVLRGLPMTDITDEAGTGCSASTSMVSFTASRASCLASARTTRAAT